MWIPEPLWQAEGKRRPHLTPLGDAVELAFSPDGHLLDLPLPRFHHGRAPWSAD
jgi:hypothetical protein